MFLPSCLPFFLFPKCFQAIIKFSELPRFDDVEFSVTQKWLLEPVVGEPRLCPTFPPGIPVTGLAWLIGRDRYSPLIGGGEVKSTKEALHHLAV